MMTIYSGFGYWNPLLMLFFFGVAAAAMLFFRAQGRSDYHRGSPQDEIFYSGNAVPQDGADISIPASAAYWGFKKACAPLYKWLEKIHNGDASDYFGYFMLSLALISLVILVF